MFSKASPVMPMAAAVRGASWLCYMRTGGHAGVHILISTQAICNKGHSAEETVIVLKLLTT